MLNALADAGLTVDDIYAVEVVGGGTRVPKIQAVLQGFLGANKTLDRHLDADESIALGASWLAANLSDGFKLNRRVGMIDGMPYGVHYSVKGLPSTEPGTVAEAEETLFPRLKKFPLKASSTLCCSHSLSGNDSLDCAPLRELLVQLSRWEFRLFSGAPWVSSGSSP